MSRHPGGYFVRGNSKVKIRTWIAQETLSQAGNNRRKAR